MKYLQGYRILILILISILENLDTFRTLFPPSILIDNQILHNRGIISGRGQL